MLALSLPLSGAFVATAPPAGGSSACARYRSVLDVVVRMDLDATRDAGATMSASRLTGGTSKFAAKHGSTVLDMGLMVDPIARNCLDRNAKIVSTLGPASFSQEMIEKLVAAGVDIFRLNSSHRRPGQFEELIPWIREAGRKAGRKVEILGDIQGPKFRCSMTVGDAPVPLEPNPHSHPNPNRRRRAEGGHRAHAGGASRQGRPAAGGGAARQRGERRARGSGRCWRGGGGHRGHPHRLVA